MVEADWGMTAVAVTLPDGTCHAVPALSSRTSRRGSESSISAREMRHIVPLDRENRWSDLLAVLIEADPASAAELLGLSDRSRQVRVRREVALSVKDRIDLMLDEETMTPTAVEVKVLSGLGPQQLRRYGELTREVDHHILIFPERMPTATAGTGWRGVTWEELLGAFTTSEKTWVAETAHAWLAHLQGAMPRVDAHTRWNALAGGDDFALRLRARMSWVYGRLRPPAPIEHDLVLSGAGRSAVARMYLPAAVPGYKVIVEAEEKLPVRGWEDFRSCGRRNTRTIDQSLLNSVRRGHIGQLRLGLPARAVAADESRPPGLGHDSGEAQVTRPRQLAGDDSQRGPALPWDRFRRGGG